VDVEEAAMENLDAQTLLQMTLDDLMPTLEERATVGHCPLCETCTGACEARVRELLTPRAETLASRWKEQGPAVGLARWIDHTLLKPEATTAQVEMLCQEAREYRFATVCVNPRFVPLCAQRLQGSGVLVCTVAGFPLGANSAEVKAHEARAVARAGAREVDMVLAIGALVAGEEKVVREELARVVEACHGQGAMCKVIIETALLDDAQKATACRLSVAAGADFVKTSTGFARGGATTYDVMLMRYSVGERVGVKAAGGIRTFEDACRMMVAGANRLGASAGVRLVEEAREFARR
jgi:deoxyribose-phosphate aldolase